ncbi:MAG: Bax inhibitor-1/YccA family protein [Bacteroidales bacterium]|nr:Bax inhibitor-1/YccA family protein [Bacteroidales bacterium]
MDFSRTSNPVFSEERVQGLAREYVGEGVMTVKGVATKTLLLFLLVFLTGSLTWKLSMTNSGAVMPLMIGGGIGALILGFIACAKADKAYIFGPLYALCEGLLLGALSAMYEAELHGIVSIAMFSTFAVAGVVFLCYRFGILKASGTFIKVISFATLGIGAFYLISVVAGLFGANISVFQFGTVGLVIQIVIVIVAALNLVLDFSSIEEGVNAGAPAKMEWYGAFGLMVTLIWIYLEILRLLAILSRRN